MPAFQLANHWYFQSSVVIMGNDEPLNTSVVITRWKLLFDWLLAKTTIVSETINSFHPVLNKRLEMKAVIILFFLSILIDVLLVFSCQSL